VRHAIKIAAAYTHLRNLYKILSLTLYLRRVTGSNTKEEFLMKMLFATVALAALLSSSADAQYGAGRGNYRAYAQVPPNATYRPRVRNQQDYWWRLYEESKSGKHCVSGDDETTSAYPSWMRCYRR